MKTVELKNGNEARIVLSDNDTDMTCYNPTCEYEIENIAGGREVWEVDGEFFCCRSCAERGSAE